MRWLAKLGNTLRAFPLLASRAVRSTHLHGCSSMSQLGSGVPTSARPEVAEQSRV